MQRRIFLKLAACSLTTAAATRPNIVLFVADDLGYGDLSSYGAPDIRTPNIDAIGTRGVKFTHFYANAPECTPTRAALLTGRYQQRVGGLECAIGVGNVGRYDEAVWLQQRGELGLPLSEVTMPGLLKKAGYDTALFGKWHLGYTEAFSPNRHGFDEAAGVIGGNADYFTHREQGGGRAMFRNGSLVERDGYVTDLLADDAIAWLRKRSGNPFFLYVPFTAPHAPIQDPDGKSQASDRSVYAKMVERMDKRIGHILEQLERSGKAGNTIVIFISDNGADANGRNLPLRGRKSSVWEGGIRVPCLMRWPGVLAAATVTGQVGITMDLLPTLLAAANISSPADRQFDGTNLLPVLTGQQQNFQRLLFWRYKRAKNVRKAVRDGGWKLVNDNGEESLHQLAEDEAEQVNRIEASPEKANELRAKLAAWEGEVQAPRLQSFNAQR
jgi:arylsulfatase A